ncbi:type III-B CRISPR module RAMP protein Cmr6 [Marinobacterium aestuarii]|uniref:Type III-B CRISPR module RAMP protein Cmr6 n=1 Tax=Marinobacterium aestuarii TaxID=1821621 RepID=A0A1A9EWI5_9GAMM|nr:type III-B CRISPR module RAMP protein Cmr6 [Marinobacterium aestuarii]ANG62217.1 type III-B CRISPR module RAMP protein Cmr6 [Marinobacterium aestuarii]
MSEYSYCPLPSANRSRLAAAHNDDGHKGLVFTRLFQGYNAKFDKDKIDPASKTKALQDCAGRCGNPEALQAACERLTALTGNLGGELRIFRTDWHFVTGMGNASPIENGFTWHPTLGTPYIPGSTVKGLVRAWAEAYTDLPSAEIRRWFGSSARQVGMPANDSPDGEKITEEHQAGELIFMDAIPLEPPQLSVDIMTPHMGKWYELGHSQDKKAILPGDWHAPVPVPFLVTREAKFIFSIAPRRGSTVDLAPVLHALEQALAWLGVGSKTAAGYGHMTLEKGLTETLQASTLSEDEQMLQKLRRLFTNEQAFGPNPASSEVRLLLQAMAEKQTILNWPADSQQRLLAVAEEALKFHDGDRWNKQTKKKKPSLYQRLSELISG